MTLTPHGWSQSAPCHPDEHLHDPSAGSHFAPLVQRQVALHPGPHVPSVQGKEQSDPLQPADASETVKNDTVRLWMTFSNRRCLSDKMCYPLCRSTPHQLGSSQWSFHRNTPGSSSSHRCHFYRDSHSELPTGVKKKKKNKSHKSGEKLIHKNHFKSSYQVNHREAGGAVASSCGAVTHASIHTQTWLHAAVAVETMRTRLVTEQTRPARLTRALSFHWVAAAEGQQTLGCVVQKQQQQSGSFSSNHGRN